MISLQAGSGGRPTGEKGTRREGEEIGWMGIGAGRKGGGGLGGTEG